ncbi:HelD family protein [Kitasatospora sp. NBC_01539]|uniref:HelD family protein n=1 Tax=Kitasatospora sp. NBC_01539 TaxID=2903577 RepID=UPI003860286C
MVREQEFIDLLRLRLAALEGRAEQAVRAALAQEVTNAQTILERDVVVVENSELVAAYASGEHGLCFGHLLFRDGTDHHVGRIGIRADDAERTPLVIDWRAERARPFYLATGFEPMGLRRRRHIASVRNRVTALHDEILDLDDSERTGHEGPDADAVLLAALDAARTGRMHDIVQTIQADQDRIIRAPHQGVFVVEGGPGTGKTAVALHRAAYLLYAQRELLARRAVLIVGPNPAFLAYIGHVLPSLGETGVLLATPAELFPGVRATGTDTAAAAVVKGRAVMAEALAAHLSDLQALPDPALVIGHEDGVLVLDREIAAAAREHARTTLLPHNLARPHFAFAVIDALTEQLVERIGHDPYGGPNLLGPDDRALLGKAIAASPDVHAAIDRLWPPLTPERFLLDYLAEPTHLSPADAEAVRRDPLSRPERPARWEWTPADVALLDEAAELLGEDDAARLAAEEARRQERIAYAQGVLDLSYGSRTQEFEDRGDEDSERLGAHDLIDAERLADRQEEADHRTAAERAAADRNWAFGHVIVDEAQELSPMAWRLLMRRCPTRSMTLVGDPAQTSEPGGCGSWAAALAPHVQDRWQHVVLDVNYRTPAEIMEVAAAVPRASDPTFVPPRSVRTTGVRPWAVQTDDLPGAVAAAVARQTVGDGDEKRRLAVIAPHEHLGAMAAALPDAAHGARPDLTRPVVLLAPAQAKGLEFDTVLVVEPSRFGANELYVALTRATQRLGIVHTEPLPFGLDLRDGDPQVMHRASEGRSPAHGGGSSRPVDGV